MELQFQLSKADLIKFYKLYLRDLIQRRSAVLIVLMIILLIPLAGNTILWSKFLFALIASPVIVLTLVYYLPLSIALIRLNSSWAKHPSWFEQKNLTVVDEGIKIESATKHDIWKWVAIKAIYSNKGFIYFTLIDNRRIIPIPRTAFKSESEAINFLGLIQSKRFQILEVLAWNNIQRSKPPYLLGLLCFIPLVGAFVGFGLLMYGIFKYKDKWLIIIGIAGILFTIGVYSSQMYDLKFGKETGKAFAQISQMQLNTLMKDIEFYKIKHGAYPDSLAQISKDDPMVSIDDPIQSRTGKSINYNYQKMGDHYYLFSSGIDGIPKTRDDLYPEVAATDSAKFGWRRR